MFFGGGGGGGDLFDELQFDEPNIVSFVSSFLVYCTKT